ncbi:hypothetical protein RVR_7289 [Actinacidiphila reveromycinica]|uniref:GtrA-like protein domain-containing protein n=1 Tax=Actinacidiphila reveromycinica TaxID=659352 RepID=A0A7U3VQX9_9ACTN|nr:hypothetical protein [Streptomyces sp. SN-593]BBB00288.1 hypothetical protein RVR_7289 [Streptomyces sp. SN-593]
MAGTRAATGAGTAPAAVRAVPAFLRFVVFGGGVTLLGSAALLLVGHRAPVAAANAVVTVVTTLLATELHTRFTFRRGRAGWSDHCASGLTVLLSYLFTTGALLGYDALHTGGGALLRQGVYLAASGAAGIARFLLLRYVFARTGTRTRTRAAVPVPVPARVRTPAASRAGGAAGGLRAQPGGPDPRAAAIPSARDAADAADAASRPPVRVTGVAAAIAATVPGAGPALWAVGTASAREAAPGRPRMLAT